MSKISTIYLKDCRVDVHNGEFADRGILYFFSAEIVNVDYREEICLVMIYPYDWSLSMTPWPHSGQELDKTGGGENFALEFKELEKEVEKVTGIRPGHRGVAGYSLGGLEALYVSAMYGDFVFTGSVSGSLWYGNAVEYFCGVKVKENCKYYFSLGQKEPLTKNRERAEVKKNTDCIAQFYSREAEVENVTNPGGHFSDIPKRIKLCIKSFGEWLNSKV